MRTVRSRGRTWTRGVELPRRPRAGRLLLGVCAGVAAQYGLDVTFVRLAFLLLGLVWGVGVLLYVALWLVMPNEGSAAPQTLREAVRRNVRAAPLDYRRSRRRLGDAWRRAESTPWPQPLNRRWIGIALVAMGAAVLVLGLGLLDWMTPMRALGLALLAGGAGVLLSLRTS